MASELSVTISDGPNAASKVVALAGEMDESNIESVRSQLVSFLNDMSITHLIFDLGQLEFINSKGIGYLVSVHTHLSKDKRVLILTAAQEAVMDVISLVGLTTIIKYFNTLDEALQNL
ncbi:STAS domain-containing protein [Candidatus Peregrinibacteria bacterium]|nr:STAS domain-containing protein [Candidatus Peregrinibacteria bacterium]